MPRFQYTIIQTGRAGGFIIAENRDHAMEQVISKAREDGGVFLDSKTWEIDAILVCPLCEKPAKLEILNIQGVCDPCYGMEITDYDERN